MYKVQDLSLLMHSEKVHILALTETHLDNSVDDEVINIPGYSIYRHDRDKNGGGVAIYIQNHIPVKVMKELMDPYVEALWLQIHLPHLKPLFVGCCYRPPRSLVNYTDDICTMLQKVSEYDREFYFLGDFNINFLDKSCALKERLLMVMNECNLSQRLNVPTRIFSNNEGVKSSTCIDHIYTNAAELCSKAISRPVGFSDHNVIAMVRYTKVPKPGPKIMLQRSYKFFNENNFIEDIKNVIWDEVMDSSDVNTALKAFTGRLFPIIDKHAPLKKFTVRSTYAPWLDEEIKHLMSNRDTLKCAAVKSGDPSDWSVYRTARNMVTKMNRHKKKIYYQDKIREVKNDSKQLWKTFNNILGKSKTTCPSFIEANGLFITKPLEIANHFNNFFIEKVEKLRIGMKSSEGELSKKLIKETIMKNKGCTFGFTSVSSLEVEKLLLSVKNNKQAGLDHLEGKIILIIAEYICAPVCHIFNLSLRDGIFPQDWRAAKIIPISKNSRASFCGANSRPISILPTLSKLLERIVFDQILHYFSANELDTVHQHAYKQSHSTCTALTEMTDDWLYQIDQKNLVGGVTLDFSAAFDVIDHVLFLGKLCAYGFDDTSVGWISSYLSNRTQRVIFNGTLSTVRRVICGVPQGSCLGPLLFSIFTNDLPLVLNNTSITLYADDSTLYAANSNLSILNSTLQNELDSIFNWVENNKLILNVTKTKCIVFGSEHALREDLPLTLFINNIALEQVKEVKLLGVILDDQLSWTHHVSNIVSKMGREVSVIKRCASFLDKHSIKQVTQALVLSHLDYCSIVWSSAIKTDIQKLQRVQNRAARMVLGCPFRANVHGMHVNLGWMKVEDRFSFNLLVFYQKVYTQAKPKTIFSKIRLIQDRHEHLTRQASRGNVVMDFPRTCAMTRMVMNRASSIWNKLPYNIIRNGSHSTFKKTIKKRFIPII